MRSIDCTSIGAQRPPFGNLGTPRMKLHASSDLHALEIKELPLLVLHKVRQLIEGVHLLKHAAPDGIAHPQIHDATISIDLVEVLQEGTVWPLLVRQLELLLQSGGPPLDVLVVAAELAAEYALETIVDLLLLRAQGCLRTVLRRSCTRPLLACARARRLASRRDFGGSRHVRQRSGCLRRKRLVCHLNGKVLLLLQDCLAFLNDIMDLFELFYLLGLEVLLVLRERVDLLLVLEQLLGLLFLHLAEVAGEERRGPVLLLHDLILCNVLRLVYCADLLCYLAFEDIFLDLQGPLDLCFLAVCPGLGGKLRLLGARFVGDHLLRCRIVHVLPRGRLRLP